MFDVLFIALAGNRRLQRRDFRPPGTPPCHITTQCGSAYDPTQFPVDQRAGRASLVVVSGCGGNKSAHTHTKRCVSPGVWPLPCAVAELSLAPSSAMCWPSRIGVPWRCGVGRLYDFGSCGFPPTRPIWPRLVFSSIAFLPSSPSQSQTPNLKTQQKQLKN